jgi:hypothetical protein
VRIAIADWLSGTESVGRVATLAGLAGSLRDSEESNPTDNLQVAADGTGADSLCRALVSSLRALTARCRGVTEVPSQSFRVDEREHWSHTARTSASLRLSMPFKLRCPTILVT